MNAAAKELTSVLKRYFGFDSFRPFQEGIICDALANRDVFAVLPTGGGKSMCYQLPALMRPGLCVVVSPLIALMKDQVDALRAIGVEATFLNSSLQPDEARSRLRALHAGRMRLLYVAPERLMLPGFLEDLRRWGVNQFAIDEAHCISEWGHDFRPDYRQLSGLRQMFPGIPIMALTATATERVRGDVLAQLHLQDPSLYVASFNRPNLTYRVRAKAGAYQQVLEFLRSRPGDAAIIYVQSRTGAETLAAKLRLDGVAAGAYHAGMESADRSRSQEQFLRDEIRVVCATIAFGMGIHKPNVRCVIHFDLPKNIEGYYQETGRAGRDGLPSECILFFSPGDVQKHLRFIEEKPDGEEQRIARFQLRQMVEYAETNACRRAELLRYFGEDYPDPACGACDNCLSPRSTYDGTILAQKFLSCVFRIHQKSHFNVGTQHVVDVLRGAETEKIRRWGHDGLSTYAIGKDVDKTSWAAIARELVRLGYLQQKDGRFPTLVLTAEGLNVLRSRRSVTLTRPVAAPASRKARFGEVSCDEALFQCLRELRKRIADELSVPPYIIFGDVSLRQMARHYPITPNDFLQISGVGERKLRDFGDRFLEAISEFLKTHPRQIFGDDDPVTD